MKITIGSLNDSRAGQRPGSARLVGRRIRQEDGSQVVRYRLDANAGDVADDLLVLFQRNVARARRRGRTLTKKHGVAAE